MPADQLDAFHYLYEPTSAFCIFVSKEQSLLPLSEDKLFGLQLAVADKENLP